MASFAGELLRKLERGYPGMGHTGALLQPPVHESPAREALARAGGVGPGVGGIVMHPLDLSPMTLHTGRMSRREHRRT